MRRHLTILFDQSALRLIEDARQRWDPVMAAVVPAHLTLAYPDEFGNDYKRLAKRAEDAAKTFMRFSISLGKVTTQNEGAGGVFLEVVDSTNSWNALREMLLTDPFRKLGVSPHMTIVHPRTSDRGPEAWLALRDWQPNANLQVQEINFTETSAREFKVVEKFPLR